MTNIFTPPQQQLQKIKELNKKHKWGFTAAHFKAVEQLPLQPTEELNTAVLVPYFGTLNKTFHELWRVLQLEFNAEYPDYTTWESYYINNKLRLYKSTHPKRQLKWVGLNLGTHKGQSPDEARKETVILAGIEILAAGMLHPKWLMAMDGRNTPYVNLFNICVEYEGAWSHVPYLYRWDGSRQLELNTLWSFHPDSLWGSPSVRELDFGSRKLETKACKLAIELFKQKVLKDQRQKNV